jgi:hypothetical protein
METLADLFISNIPDENGANRENASLMRLRNQAARVFYGMFFDWRINQVNYGRMISNFMKYWKKIIENESDTLVFAGRWGTIAREGFLENYVDLRKMTDYELTNLAIVRIKEEQDFIDNNLVKYLEVLNDLKIVETSLYNKVKYGTDDASQIALIRSGISHISAHVLVDRYRSFISINSIGSVEISSRISSEFLRRNERKIITFEVESSGLLT